ncbi:MAG: alpha/beta hydrolase [Myxococcales bacterium]|nr:alpha/beta hydrolase [Myxococcales bacterium]
MTQTAGGPGSDRGLLETLSGLPIRTVRANGLSIAYHEMGTGPLVLLLHGFPDTARTWEHLMPSVASWGYRVVAPYLRGYAPTSLPSADTTTEDLGHDVLALMEALGERSAVLVGHDWGASAAYTAAAMAPERFSALVAVAIPHPLSLRPSVGLLWRGRHFLTLRLRGAERRLAAEDFAGVEALVRRWAPSWSFGEGELADVKKCFSQPGSLKAALGYYRAFRGTPELFRNKLPMPALLVAGREDLLPLSAFERSQRGFTGPFEIQILECGHFPHREQALAFRNVLGDFLGTVPAA